MIACAVALQGCAYVTVTPVELTDRTTKGLRIFDPKPYVVVNASGVSTVYLPDCKRAYAVQFGSVFAKNDLNLDLTNGMLNKLESKQDTTVLGTNFLSAVTEAAKAGKSLGTAFSASADGGTTSFNLLEATCDGGRLTLTPVTNLTGLAVAGPAPPRIPADTGEAGTPPPR